MNWLLITILKRGAMALHWKQTGLYVTIARGAGPI
jgi:hypothetical protein